MLTSRVRNIEFLNAESLDYSPITNYDGQGLCERMWFMPNINEYFQEYNDEMKMKDNIIKEIILPWADSKGWVETKEKKRKKGFMIIARAIEIKRPKNIEAGRKQSSSSRFSERCWYALMNFLCCCTRPCHTNNSHT